MGPSLFALRKSVLIIKANTSSINAPHYTSQWFMTLTLLWRRSLSYRNQSIDLQSKSMDWFLYDSYLRHEKLNWWSIPKHTVQMLKLQEMASLVPSNSSSEHFLNNWYNCNNSPCKKNKLVIYWATLCEDIKSIFFHVKL